MASHSQVVSLSLAEAEALTIEALSASGASSAQAAAAARSLVAAEADGQSGHGLSRVPSYASQLRAGKVTGSAKPKVSKKSAGVVHIDAQNGLGYLAIELAISLLGPLTAQMGVAAAGVFGSHHIGMTGRVVEQLANLGLVALVTSNTPAAIAFAGGRRAMMGTNPIAFAAPIPGRSPMVIDMALSQVARSKVIAAKKAGQPIPSGWALDADGVPTTDPAMALEGSLQPIGGAKGAALALMVEVLCGALAGGRYGWEASSFLDDVGPSPSVGQLLIAFSPAAFAGEQFSARMADIASAVTEQGGRLPGDRRLVLRSAALQHGLSISSELFHDIVSLKR